MKILGSFWFGHIGFVKVDNGFEKKIYMGEALGRSEEEDTNHIVQHGYPVAVQQFINFLQFEDNFAFDESLNG